MAILTTTTNGLNFIGGTTYIQTGTTTLMSIAVDGSIAFNEYGAGYLKTDASGNITADNTGGGLPGGPYLPLSAGSGEILTGDLAMNNNKGIITKDSSGAFRDILKLNSSNVLEIGSSSLATNTIFKNSGNVGIGTTSPNGKLTIKDSGFGTAYNNYDALYIDNGSVTAGSGNYGNGIGFSRLGSQTYKKAAIAPVQGTSDSDNLGLAFFTSPNSGFADVVEEAMRINYNGNVGIGTTSPSNKLEIVGANALRIHDGTDQGSIFFRGDRDDVYIKESSYQLLFGAPSGMLFELDTNNNDGDVFNVMHRGSSRFYINGASGNVGIGTTSPVVKLHVGTATLGAAPDTNADVISSGGITIDHNKRLSFDTAYYVHGNIKYNTTNAAVTEAKLEYQGYYGHNFITRSSSKMVIKGDTGNVGIGTTTPSTKLDVLGGSGNDVIAKFKTTGTGTNDYSEIHIANNNEDRLVIGSIGSNYANSTWAGMRYVYATAGDLGLKATASNGNVRIYAGSAGNERMRIASNGNVGIGTTSPDTKLHVEGNVLIDTYNQGEDNGLFFREGFLTIDQPSITVWDMSNSGASPDGLSINAQDGIRFRENGGEVARFKDGNLGIGTLSPVTKLEVAGDVTISGDTKDLIFSNTAETKAGIVFTDAQAGTGQAAAIKFDCSAETLDFFVNDESAERMSINTSGVLTINGGNIILNGTGRIQGVDTVSAGTDAANKAYVDLEIATRTPLNDIRSLGVEAFTNGANPNITTAQVMDEIDFDGGFDSYSSVFKTSWSYAGNYNLTDAGDFTETAGSSWITWTDNSSDSTRGNITTLAIAPNTGGSAGGVFIYNNQGGSYSPGWRQVWTSMTDGAGSGLDADLLDGQQGSYYATAASLGNYLPLAGGNMTGDIQMGANSVKFDQSGTRSWDISPGSGNLNITSGDSGGLVFLSPGISVEDNASIGGYLKVIGDIRGNGQQLILNAGESSSYATGQTSEYVFVNAENGLIVNSSPNNWSSGWAGRNTTYINKADGTSSFTGKISVQGSNVIEIDQGTSFFNHVKVLSTFGSKLFSANNYGYILESSSTSADPVTFRFDNARYRIFSGSGGEALTVLANKNVGIGVTSPGSKLEVGGNALIDGVLTIEGPAPVATSPMLKLTRTSPVVDYQDLGTYYLLTERFKNSGGTIIGSREVWQNPGGSGLYYNFDNGSTGGSQHRQKQNSFHWTINSNSEKLTIGTNGYLGVNDTSPSYQLDVNGSGRFTSTVTATNFILSSDERLKENIEKVCDNRVEVDWKTFELKADKGQKRYGVIAQELEKTNPEFVREGADGFKSVAYIDLLIAKIAELEARLEKLEK